MTRTVKAPPRDAPLRIRLDSKGWVTQLTICPMRYETLDEMAEGLVEAIETLEDALTKVQRVRAQD